MAMDMTIGEAAEILGISQRTLRYWDEVGLLSPSWRTGSNYRLYTEEDLDTALLILIYRSVGMPLKEIKELVAEPSSSLKRLQKQRELLEGKRQSIDEQITAIEEIIAAEQSGKGYEMTKKVELLHEAYADEAQQRWGDTPEWEASQKATQNMTPEDMQAHMAIHEEFVAELEKAKDRGVEPGSEEAAALVEKHREWLSKFYPVSVNKQVILARMYVSDDRFDQTYKGNAQYLLDIVERYAQNVGVDLAQVEWE